MCQHPDIGHEIDEKNWRRFEREHLRDPFANRGNAAWYPGYDAEEVDDGRLDQPAIVRNGFVPSNELPDTHEQYEPSEEDVQDERDRLTIETLKAIQVNQRRQPRGPRSPVKGREVFHNRLRSMLPLKNVQKLVRGQGLVPYKPVPYQR